MPRHEASGPDPTQVGPYLIERKLGSGGMGTVYLARHEETGRETAVKVLAPSLARDAGLVARFTREIDAMRKLKNPHVVELYDHGVDGDTYYYAMEYVDGETLTARLRRDKRINWRVVIDLSTQICAALKAAHDAGIIHRDLKPSNLLLTADGRIKLTDFGVAQVFAGSKLTITGGIIGTAEYMSPEQAQGKRITKRSDLYALGAVMYVMLTGRPPFSGKTTLDVLHKHKYGQFDRPRLIVPEIPSWLDDLVCQLMEKEPEKRFADAYVVSRKLQEILRIVDLSTGAGTMRDRSTLAESSTFEVDSQARDGPGQGTLMRDLFRAQYEADHAQADWRRLLENTWVLLGMLALLVVGVAWWTLGTKMTPEKRLRAGIALLDRDEDANWRTVRDEYFAPLQAQGSDDWDEPLEPYLARIRRHEEIERIVGAARRREQAGDVPGAKRMLNALGVLVDGNPRYVSERRLIDRRISSLNKKSIDRKPDRSLLGDTLDRADALAADGNRDEAVRLWKSVVELYGNDPEAAADVDRARQKLGAATAKASP